MGLAASEVAGSETRRCAAVSRGVVRVPRAGERLKRSRVRSEEHTSELQSPCNLVCRLLLEKKKTQTRHVGFNRWNVDLNQLFLTSSAGLECDPVYLDHSRYSSLVLCHHQRHLCVSVAEVLL